jgi:hypothetical protein
MSEREEQRLLHQVSAQFRERAVFPVGLQRYWEYAWTLRTLREVLGEGSEKRIADIGCGDGALFTDVLAAHSSCVVYACDPEPLPGGAHPCIYFSQQTAEQFCAQVAPGLALDAVRRWTLCPVRFC